MRVSLPIVALCQRCSSSSCFFDFLVRALTLGDVGKDAHPRRLSA